MSPSTNGNEADVNSAIQSEAPIEGDCPLDGLRIALTHDLSGETDPLTERLHQSGAVILACPCIEIVPPEDLSSLREAIRHLVEYDWVLFTSKNAVDSVVSILVATPSSTELWKRCRIAAVGAATARRLAENGLQPDLVPEEFTGRGLAQALIEQGQVMGRRFLFPASEIAREELPSLLQQSGGTVDRVTAYRTVTYHHVWPCLTDLLSDPPQAVSFSSPSAAKGFLEKLGEAEFRRITSQAVSFSIGKTTTAALKELGIERIEQAATSCQDGLYEAILKRFGH